MILLTGASGYLGRHVRRLLNVHTLPHMATSRTGFSVYLCDLLDQDSVRRLLGYVQPSVVIHCAAMVPKQMADYQNSAWCEATQRMSHILHHNVECPIVFASSLVAEEPSSSKYAIGKYICERWLQMRERDGDVILRLPGLFGLPRRDGRLYRHATDGSDYGTEPAMHVTDAAEYLVRAATMPSDGNREPFSVTYGDPRLEAVYKPLGDGVTFESRVREFVAEVQREQAQA